MLYVFVDSEQNHVFYATYDKIDFELIRQRLNTELVAKYWDDVEIYEVKEIDD